MSQTLSQQAAQALEWPKVLECLAQGSQSVMGAARCRGLALHDDVDTVVRRQQETTEWLRLGEGSDPAPSLACPDVRDLVERAWKGGNLDALELRDVLLLLTVMEEVARFVGRHQADAPTVAAMAAPLEWTRELRAVKLALEGAIQPDGAVKESASPALRRLTHAAQELKQRMREQLERILHSSRFEEVLQESYFAQREGRYVLPVKADMRGRIPGIVHDVSASGATVFLEPRELVDLNNAIKVGDLDIQREVQRILRELTLTVAAQAEALLAGVGVVTELDCLQAKAALSRRLKASPVSINDVGRVVLKQARHPLLMLAKDQVVPNDVLLDESIRVLVISGPNTGGKTVTLKIVGLFSLMVRAGLHLPCAPESEMAIFPDVYADIGDAQDLSRDLSSFSAHMSQMVRLLAESSREMAGGASSLVLLDEPVTSTDPQEGAALAEALLCRLASLNMKVVATTHYGALKELAQTTPGFANASVEFDVSRMAPTYRLFWGIPGGSSALEIAGRLGMEAAILADARQRLHQEHRRVDDVMADLQRTQRVLADELARAERARAEAERAADEAKAIEARLAEAEEEARKGLKKKIGEQFQRARAEVQATVDAVKREQKLIKAKEAKQRLLDMEAQARQELAPPGQPVPLEQLAVGDQVEIAGLGMTGSLLEAPQGKKRVRVKVGEGEVLVTVANLVGLPRGVRTAAPVPPPSPSRRVFPTTGLGLDEQTVVDVRGQAADEALDQVIAALDRAALDGAPYLRIIHGHGTGKLKAIVREYLRDSPYVATMRPGDKAEGVDGVTVVTLR